MESPAESDTDMGGASKGASSSTGGRAPQGRHRKRRCLRSLQAKTRISWWFLRVLTWRKKKKKKKAAGRPGRGDVSSAKNKA